MTRRTPLWLVALVALLCANCEDGETEPPAPGAMVADFRLETMQRTRFYLHQQRGKAVVLVFWETWCKVCKEELRSLQTMQRQVGSERVVVASVLGDPENRDAAATVLRGIGVDLPTLLDPGRKLAARLGVREVPTTLIVDPQGRLSFRRQGYDAGVARQIRQSVERLSDIAPGQAAP